MDITPPERIEEFSGASFQKGHVAEDVDVELEHLVFVLDVQELNPGIRRLRDWALSAVAPAPGDLAVDVGCGTGTETRRLAELVGETGRAVGVEPQAALRQVAVERAASAASRAEFVDGDALALPFEDASVDVLRCERVWQHLSDPAAAAREVARVLAPGGRAVIVDTDWGTQIVHPGDPDVLSRYRDHTLTLTPSAIVGRQLANLLGATGLAVDPDVGSSAVVFDQQFLAHPVMLQTQGAEAVAGGAITQAELDALVAGVSAAAERGEAFAFVTMLAAVARWT